MAEAPVAGAVAIGRNEGPRLEACLASLRPCSPIVYVDSGSTDGSLAIARAAGAVIVELDTGVPFTAARARNAGLAALEAAAPLAEGGPALVQFVDGDTAVRDGWLAAAAAFLGAHPDHAVVCGRRRERFPGASPWNRVIDMEWNTPTGDARACGGDALMRRKALAGVDGFREDLIAGEEPELCYRLRRAGWRIHRLDAEMTWHDAAITRFAQHWRRATRAGWAAVEGWVLHGRGPERYNRHRVRPIAIWGIALPAIALLSLVVAALAALSAAPVPAWPGLAAALGVAALYPLQAVRVAGHRRRRGDPWRHALLYGVVSMIDKPAQAAGAWRYWRQRRAGGPARLIEYRGADAG
ncbi:MAG: glycosyltransferase family 2 protein [Pseudomonadota bacterium]